MSISGVIKTLFSDHKKTQAIFPRTKVSAVSDDNGVGLGALLEKRAYAGLVSGGFAVTELGQIGSGLLSYYNSMDDLTIKHIYIEVKVNGLELTGGRWIATIYKQHGSLAVVKVIELIGSYELSTTITNGAVGQFEYVDPPMIIGVEYRTTERYEGKAVYTQMVNCGNCPNTSYKEVTTTVPTAATIIKFEAFGTNAAGNHIGNPIIDYGTGTVLSRLTVTAANNINIVTYADASDVTVVCRLWYTKD